MTMKERLGGLKDERDFLASVATGQWPWRLKRFSYRRGGGAIQGYGGGEGGAEKGGRGGGCVGNV